MKMRLAKKTVNPNFCLLTAYSASDLMAIVNLNHTHILPSIRNRAGPSPAVFKLTAFRSPSRQTTSMRVVGRFP
jgi:hypothetical protein